MEDSRGSIVVVDCSRGLAYSGMLGTGRDGSVDSSVHVGSSGDGGSAGGGVGARSDCGGRVGEGVEGGEGNGSSNLFIAWLTITDDEFRSDKIGSYSLQI